jgi:hypothetical protein
MTLTDKATGYVCVFAPVATARSRLETGRTEQSLGPPNASDAPMLQVGRDRHRPLLTVDDRCRPMLRRRFAPLRHYEMVFAYWHYMSLVSVTCSNYVASA